MSGVHKSPLIIAFVLLAALTGVSSASGQDLDYYRRVLLSDNREAKRTVLFEIQNLHSETAARIAVHALTDKDEMVRATAVSAVASLPPADAAASIIPLLSDKSAFVRMSAAYALNIPEATAVVAPLIDRLQHDKDKAVRAAAASSLGPIGDPAAYGPLTAELQRKRSEDTEFIRRMAARSIGRVADKARTQHLQGPPPVTVQTLIKVLNDRRETDDTHREAAAALGLIGDPAAIPSLTSHLNSADPYLAEQCRKSLESIRRGK